MKKSVFRNILFSVLIFIFGVFSTLLFYNLIDDSDTIVTAFESDNENIELGVEKIYDASVLVRNLYSEDAVNKSGSGFVYEKEDNKYYIITNEHVVRDANSLEIQMSNGDIYEAISLGGDEFYDVAVLYVETEDELKVAEIGSSEELKLGETLFAVGSPINSYDYIFSVTKGVVSYLNREILVYPDEDDYEGYVLNTIQTDTTTNQGNSGGPLCNVDGQVIGINTRKVLEVGVDGLSFAVPIEDVTRMAEKILAGDFAHASLGIDFDIFYYGNPSLIEPYYEYEDYYGVVVSDVIDNDVLLIGDIIKKINGNDTSSEGEYRHELFKLNKGDKVTITVLRNHELIELESVVS